eukprot:TRINITY_DN2512_c0_g1_i7.p1 TRINITY_DN2512_c0_g1~~TRINITY_DN2512_c0_g1_i7.p1  ORF type:complete len:380 (+),score=61.67 TRINITY_DN2512_c0_g1_i7:881-2020(+)
MRDGALTIDMYNFCSVQYDPVTTYATIGMGCDPGDVYAVLDQYGRYILTGINQDVGIAGSTLLGGQGYLTKQYGLACDNVVTYRMMKMTTGEIINVTKDSDPELFWGLSGAGAYLGIVTQITVKTYQAPSKVYAGELRWIGTVNNTYRPVLRAFLSLRDQLRASNNRKLVSAPLFIAPPGGVQHFVLLITYDGSKAELGNLLDPLLNLNPDYNSLQEDIYSNSLNLELKYTPAHYPILFWGRNFRDDVDLYTVLDNMYQFALANPDFACSFEDLQGGAMDELPSDYNAFGWRPSPPNGALVWFAVVSNGNYNDYITRMRNFPNTFPNTFNNTAYANYFMGDVDKTISYSPNKILRINALIATYDPHAILIANGPPQLVL